MGANEAIEIRPVRAGDEVLVQEIFDGMSPEARYYRFLQATPVLSPSLRRLLAAVDGERHRAWSAHLGDRPVGIVRLVRDRHGDLELSVSVVDALHRRGIGGRLVETALEAAGDEPVKLVIHPENSASVLMFRKLGANFRYELGLLVGIITAPKSLEVAA